MFYLWQDMRKFQLKVQARQVDEVYYMSQSSLQIYSSTVFLFENLEISFPIQPAISGLCPSTILLVVFFVKKGDIYIILEFAGQALC